MVVEFALDGNAKNLHNPLGFSQFGHCMNRPQKKDNSPTTLIPAMVCRSWCVLFVLWLFVPPAFADGFRLTNPAEKDFGEFRSETKTTGNFAQKTPTLNDRTLPNHKKAEKIRQVSTFGEDPFASATSTPPAQVPAFDWGTVESVVPHNPLLAQNNMVFYDPNAAGGYVEPYAVMQNMYQPGMEMGYLPQFTQYPQQFHPQQFQQGFMANGINPHMNPYANMYPQYGHTVDPYSMGYQMAYQENHQTMPDYSQVYQAMMLQEMMRRQAEEVPEKTNQEKNTDEAKKQAGTTWSLDNLVPVRVSSPLGETMLACAKTISPFTTPTGPDKGVGMPLANKSWLDHPYYLGGFVGYMSGSELVAKMVEQKNGGTGGFIFGYNFNDYWGLESRLHFTSIDIQDTDYARELLKSTYPDLIILPTTRTNELTVLDAAVHYYPLGNARWRPYFKYGLGLGQQKFADTFGFQNTADIVTMPLGMGVRYWWNERLAFQADLTDNVIFASGNAKTQHNVAFTLGLTYAFGTGKTKHPVHYWPATPSMGAKW
jgi:hypothetical protein